MEKMRHLPENKRGRIFEMVDALSRVKGVEAVTLGGSYARGTARIDSDVDLAIYYSEKSPPSIDALCQLAKKFDPVTQPLVTHFYEWGPWVNGGAWLNTDMGEVDWLYRNLDQVNRVIADANQGRFAWDFRQQPPYGFFSVMYLADLQHNVALYDPQEVLAHLKDATRHFPDALREAIIREHLWSVEFAHFGAQKFAKRGCVYGTVGCMTRIAAELTQVLFALNRIYFSTERTALETIDAFAIKPKDYGSRIQDILSVPGKGEDLIASLKKLHAVIREVIKLCEPIYAAKYPLE